MTNYISKYRYLYCKMRRKKENTVKQGRYVGNLLQIYKM